MIFTDRGVAETDADGIFGEFKLTPFFSRQSFLGALFHPFCGFA